MSDLQRSGPGITDRDNEFELNFLHNKLITVPKNVQCGSQQHQNDQNDEENLKKADTVDKRFWKKLRMIKVYQNCRFCNKSNNILNGVHLSIPGSFCASIQKQFNSHHWALIALQQSLTHCFPIQPQQKSKNKSQNDTFQQTQSSKLTKFDYISELKSVKKMKELVQYYKYYQYIPLTPQNVTISAKCRQPKAFVLVHDFLDKKITIFYRRIKQMLADKNSQDSLQASSQNQNQQQSQQSKSDQQMDEKKVVSKRLFDSESNISSQSVRDLLCQIGDSTNVIKSSAKSSFLDGKPKNKNILRNQYFSNVDARTFEQQLLDKNNCHSNKNSLKKSTKKGSNSNKKRLSMNKKEKGAKISYKTQPIAKREVESDEEKPNRQDKKLRMSTNISTKKLKKKKMRNSCDNLMTHAAPPKKYQVQRRKKREMTVKGSERNLSKLSEAPLFEQKKIRNYIVDLKRKINKDKEKLRENYQEKATENHSFKLRYKTGEPIQIMKSKEDRGIKQKKRKIENNNKEKQYSCQKSDFKTLIPDKKGEKDDKLTNQQKKNGLQRDMTRKQQKQQKNESPLATGAQQSKKKGGKQKMSKKKNIAKIGSKQKVKTTTRNRGEQTNTYKIKKEQTEELKKQANEKLVSRNKKIGRRQKSNIFNTRVHSSITTQLDF